MSERYERAQTELGQANERGAVLEEDCRRVSARCERIAEQSEQYMKECVNLSGENAQSFAEATCITMHTGTGVERSSECLYSPTLFGKRKRSTSLSC